MVCGASFSSSADDTEQRGRRVITKGSRSLPIVPRSLSSFGLFHDMHALIEMLGLIGLESKATIAGR
jgi:hypothetical protein